MENKIKELQNKLPEGVDSFISLDEKTVLYLTGFSMNDGALFVTRDDAVLFVDFRYIEAASEEAKNCRVVMPEKNFYESIKEIMAECGIKTVGFEENCAFATDMMGNADCGFNFDLIPYGNRILFVR